MHTVNVVIFCYYLDEKLCIQTAHVKFKSLLLGTENKTKTGQNPTHTKQERDRKQVQVNCMCQQYFYFTVKYCKVSKMCAGCYHEVSDALHLCPRHVHSPTQSNRIDGNCVDQQVQYPDKCPTYHTQMHTDTEYKKSTVSLRPLLTAQKPQDKCKRY